MSNNNSSGAASSAEPPQLCSAEFEAPLRGAIEHQWEGLKQPVLKLEDKQPVLMLKDKQSVLMLEDLQEQNRGDVRLAHFPKRRPQGAFQRRLRLWRVHSVFIPEGKWEGKLVLRDGACFPPTPPYDFFIHAPDAQQLPLHKSSPDYFNDAVIGIPESQQPFFNSFIAFLSDGVALYAPSTPKLITIAWVIPSDPTPPGTQAENWGHREWLVATRIKRSYTVWSDSTLPPFWGWRRICSGCEAREFVDVRTGKVQASRPTP